MKSKEELQAQVSEATKALADAQAELEAFESLAENHVYKDMEEAQGYLEEILRDRAYEDCQGAHNCGDEEYRQEFIVDGVKWLAILSVEYNRHDKTYYYIESADLRIEPIKAEA